MTKTYLLLKPKTIIFFSLFIYSTINAIVANADMSDTDPLDADIYFAYGTLDNVIIEGRIIEKRNTSTATTQDSKLKNLWRKLRQLINDEKKFENITIVIANTSYKIKTDEEGYFRLDINTPEGLKEGWNPLLITLMDNSEIKGELLIVPQDNQIGIISDFDDTVIYSDITNTGSMLKKSLLQNYTQRKPVDGMASLYQAITQRNPQPDSTPVMFVSASPRQIQRGIVNFLNYNNFPKSQVVTKTITGKGKYSLKDNKSYKLDKIQDIFKRLPQVNFVLVGDDGEQDPESFSEIQKSYANRVIAVWIHNVHPDPERTRFPNQQLFKNNVDHLTLPVTDRP